VTLDVIGAGFGRTGTMSFQRALNALGVGPCYHMLEVYANDGHDEIWASAINGNPVDWDALFAAYRSVCDWPAVSFWRELKAANPMAKVVLTRRDPDEWYDSIARTIFLALERHTDDEGLARWRDWTRKLIFEQTFGNRLDRANVVSVLRTHEADVIASVPADELLVYDVAEGWPPLCDFLGAPVPDEPFPRLNSTAEFRVWTGLDSAP
jgi:sulfotransferase family protein